MEKTIMEKAKERVKAAEREKAGDDLRKFLWRCVVTLCLLVVAVMIGSPYIDAHYASPAGYHLLWASAWGNISAALAARLVR